MALISHYVWKALNVVHENIPSKSLPPSLEENWNAFDPIQISFTVLFSVLSSLSLDVSQP